MSGAASYIAIGVSSSYTLFAAITFFYLYKDRARIKAEKALGRVSSLVGIQDRHGPQGLASILELQEGESTSHKNSVFKTEGIELQPMNSAEEDSAKKGNHPNHPPAITTKPPAVIAPPTSSHDTSDPGFQQLS